MGDAVTFKLVQSWLVVVYDVVNGALGVMARCWLLMVVSILLYRLLFRVIPVIIPPTSLGSDLFESCNVLLVRLPIR